MVNELVGNICPVCAYKMDDPPRDYNICPSCGTEFGVSDLNSSILELREMWIKTGPKWWSVTDPQPMGWNPFAQLACFRIFSGTSDQKTSPSAMEVRWAKEVWDPQSASRQSSLVSR